MPSHSSIAQSIRLNKEARPEKYCHNPRCLWRTETRQGFKPCPKHPAPKDDSLISFAQFKRESEKPDSYAAFVVLIPKRKNLMPMWRLGQTAFNVLNETRPDLADEIRATDNDPYHNDARLPNFYRFVMAKWDS